jgi:hypothetical protein
MPLDVAIMDLVRVHTSTIDQRKSQTQIKYNAYASQISKRFCSENPNEAIESFNTAPNRAPKRRINLTCADAAANSSHIQEQDNTHPKADTPIAAPHRTQDRTSVTSSDNSSHLVELESSIQSIDSERLYFQSEFQKVITSALQHSKQIQAIQSDMRGLSVMVLELRNNLLPNAPPLPPRSTISPMWITDDLSSLISVPANSNAPSFPHCKTLRGDKLASPSHISTTWDSQKESGISLDPRECYMNAPNGSEQY